MLNNAFTCSCERRDVIRNGILHEASMWQSDRPPWNIPSPILMSESSRSEGKGFTEKERDFRGIRTGLTFYQLNVVTKSLTSKRPAGNIICTNEGIIKARLEQNTLQPSWRVQLMLKLSLALNVLFVKDGGKKNISGVHLHLRWNIWYTVVCKSLRI